MMKMHFSSTYRKTVSVPTVNPIPIPIPSAYNNVQPSISYPISSMIDRIQNTGGCSACGRK